MTIIDNAVYVNGIRTASPESLEQSVETLAAHGGMVWIGLYRPDETEMAAVAAEFGLHLLAVEDAVNAHQRPKLERYDNNLFTVLRPARYLDHTETVEFGELHIFTGKNFVVTVRHAETPGVAQVRRHLEQQPELLRHGPEAVLYANRQNEASAAQNEQTKKISSWAAIFFAPAFVTGLYGMNFEVMPELHWLYGYPMALGMMVAGSLIMYLIFKRKNWL